jgi:hypothetical protein
LTTRPAGSTQRYSDTADCDGIKITKYRKGVAMEMIVVAIELVAADMLMEI